MMSIDSKSRVPEPVEEPTGASPRSLLLYRASQTFLARTPPAPVIWLRIFTVAAVVLLFFIVIPGLTVAGAIPDYKLNLLGKYLSFALVALGIDLIWGYTGILSLCQALFFCVGGYAMGMHLSLPEGGGVYKIPQFMEFAYYGHHGELPPFWRPFAGFEFAVLAGLLLPAGIAAIFGFFIFRSRVRDVYFSIITQAVAWGTFLLISRNEMLLGGTNGLTNFYRPLSQDRRWILGLYFLTLVVVILGYLLCRAIVRSQVGRVLVAVRDKETRLYFAGYRPYTFKVFAFAVAAMLAGAGGMLYAPQVGIITPQDMNVEASILMVIWVALGGRGKLWGAIFGALVVNVLRGSLSSDLPSMWLFVEGGMFLAVVLFFPNGFVGLWDKMERQLATGEGWTAALASASPMIIVTVFVLAEALGLMPGFLRVVVSRSDKIGDVQLKYMLLLVMLAGAAGYQIFLRRARQAGEPRAFPVVASATGGGS